MGGSERGVALVITLIVVALLSAITAGLVLATSTDALIAANVGAASETFYAADAAFDRTVEELRLAGDLTAVLDGSATSGFVDGAPAGERTLSDGSTIVLEEVVNQANCEKPTSCDEADLNASVRGRPWGSLNPRWRLFSYGPLTAPEGASRSDLPPYVITMVADDPHETDDDPWRDGVQTGAAANPGAGVLLVRAEAFGRRGSRRVVHGAVVRRDRAALARWSARDPATRGPAPPGFPVLQVVAWEAIR